MYLIHNSHLSYIFSHFFTNIFDSFQYDEKQIPKTENRTYSSHKITYYLNEKISVLHSLINI